MTAVLTPRHRGSGKAVTPLSDLSDTFGGFGKRSVAVASATGVALTAVVASTAASTIPAAPLPAAPKADFVSHLASTGTATLVSIDANWDSGDTVAVTAAQPVVQAVTTEQEATPASRDSAATAGDGYRDTAAQAPPPRAANGSIADTALSYVGSAYTYAGSGPYAFDCSGFTSYIYGLFGIYLPHSSYAQGDYGTPISEAEAQPGDLVVWPYGHVAIYLGDGRIVHAADESQGVTVGSLWGSYYFVRL